MIKIMKTGVPTKDTKGALGQHYIELDTGAEYKCIDIIEKREYERNHVKANSFVSRDVLENITYEYVWELVSEGGSTGGGAGTVTVTSVNGVQPDENGNVTVEVGQPTDAQIGTAVDTWLNEHPEATTTVADGSITPEKLANTAVTKAQLFDTNDFWQNATSGYFPNTDTKLTGSEKGYITSPFYEVMPNTTYAINFQTYQMRYFDVDKNNISPNSWGANVGKASDTAVDTWRFTTIDNVKYIRFAINLSITFNEWISTQRMICLGRYLYDDFFVGEKLELVNTGDFKIDGGLLKEESIPGKALIPGDFPISGLSGVTILMQIFDGLAFWQNNSAGYLPNNVTSNVGTGTEVYKVSTFLPAKPDTMYTLNFWAYQGKIYCYNAIKGLLGNVTQANGQFVTLPNTAYIRFGTSTWDSDAWKDDTGAGTAEFMICEGDSLFTGFAPAGEQVVINGLQVDRCARPNSVNGAIIKDKTIPASKVLAGTADLRILCLGDSLTEGKYPAKVAELLTCEVIDAGVGGNTINAINNRVGNYGTDFNVVTLMCGTNDNGGQTSCPLGTIDDEAATNDNHSELTTTYVSRLKRLLNTIKATHPGAIYILMPPFEHEWGDFEGVVNMMEEIAKLYRIPYLDIFHECGWSGKNESDKAIYMADSTHENAVGAQRIAGMLAGYIRQLTGM
jgi:lysophospholipase L1-like esterase